MSGEGAVVPDRPNQGRSVRSPPVRSGLWLVQPDDGLLRRRRLGLGLGPGERREPDELIVTPGEFVIAPGQFLGQPQQDRVDLGHPVAAQRHREPGAVDVPRGDHPGGQADGGTVRWRGAQPVEPTHGKRGHGEHHGGDDHYLDGEHHLPIVP